MLAEALRLAPPLLVVALTVACSTEDSAPTKTEVNAEPADFVMEGGPYTLAPGEEKYLCYTANVPDATSFHSFSIDDYPSVHHMFFARTLAPEEEGVHECPTLFKPTWLPLFTTGNGGTRLELPQGSGFPIDAGAQLVMQLHLLNTTDRSVTETVTVNTWTLPPEEAEYEAALFPFGTTVFELPPQGKSSVTHDCVMHKSMEAFVAFPHMHVQGTDMRFAIGKDEASLTEVFGEPYDFDNQQLLPVSFQLEPGDLTRVTCNFDNKSDNVLRYGESTLDEMCFFSIFIKHGDALDGHCVDMSALATGTSSGPAPECNPVANELGVGAPCTGEGGECAEGLSCSAALSSQAGETGICMSVAKCGASADCGSGATCCAPPEGGGAINICIPEVCRPTTCTPVD